jgi:hypothetical protein
MIELLDGLHYCAEPFETPSRGKLGARRISSQPKHCDRLEVQEEESLGGCFRTFSLGRCGFAPVDVKLCYAVILHDHVVET